MNYNLLNNLSTTCPSKSLINGINNLKIKTIINEIDKEKYDIKIESGAIIVTNKNFNINKNFITVSSHLDNVYENPFVKQDGSLLYGTFDNSLTNLVLLEVINHINKNQIVFLFSDNEENNESTIANVKLCYNKKFKFNVCLDVTPYCHYTHFATIENDKDKLGKKLLKNKDFAFIPLYQSMNDETCTAHKNNIKGFSFCLPVNFIDNRCHNKKGGQITTFKLEKYYNLLLNYLNNVV